MPGRPVSDDAILPDRARCEKLILFGIGPGEGGPILLPIAEEVRGADGGIRLGRVPVPGVCALRIGLSGRDNEGRIGVLGCELKALRSGESAPLRYLPGVRLGGESALGPFGGGSWPNVGVGGSIIESVLNRLLVLARGTKMPDICCVVVKYRTLLVPP